MQSEASNPDLLYKLLAWFETNKKQVIYGACGVVVVGIIVGFLVWRSDQVQRSASEAFSNLMVNRLVSGGRTPVAPADFLKVARDHKGTDAGARALLAAAQELFVEGKATEAETQFRAFQSEYAGSPLGGQAALGIAASLDGQGKTDPAIAAYREVTQRFPNESAATQARFALGRIFESQNKPGDARQMFEEVARTDGTGVLGSEAGLRAEEILRQHPELKPAAPKAPETPGVPLAPKPAAAPAAPKKP